MGAVFFISVILKGIGALLEVLIQITITRGVGLTGYGEYSAFINAADLVFWLLFSGLVKCNTFYLSDKGVSTSRFHRHYYLRYVLPVLAGFGAVAAAFGGRAYSLMPFIILAELLMMDLSSTMMAQGQEVPALLGEYVAGRAVLLTGAVILCSISAESILLLSCLYGLQFLCAALFLILLKEKRARKDISINVSLKKWALYQRADIVQAMIGQMPVILQFFFAGAFEAGVVSIVLLVKRLINFISGPTAKVFLPEFSRLYKQGKNEEIRDCFAMIMRVQMLFAGPMAVVLIGFPQVVLRILADELLDYTNLCSMCSCVFIFAATLGPCGGVMQMTGNEKFDNYFREGAVFAMAAVFFIFRHNTFFVLYGLCAQTLLEAGGKYLYVCRWMKKAPVSILTYLSWWIVPATGIAISFLLKINTSLPAMLMTALAVFGFGTFREWKRGDILAQIRKKQ